VYTVVCTIDYSALLSHQY